MSSEQQVYAGYIKAGRDGAFDEVLEFLDSESKKLRECGDTESADYVDMLCAKLKFKREARGA